jgi:chorismate mutase
MHHQHSYWHLRMQVVVLLLISIAAGGCRPAAVPGIAGQNGADVDRLLSLMQQRLALMDEVARWKWSAGQQIVDPKRERELLEKVVERGQAKGLDPELIRGFFAAQMEAAKSLQQARFDLWSANKQKPDAGAGDLTVLRKRIDALNDELIDALAQLSPRLPDPAVQQTLRQHAQEILSSQDLAPVREMVIAPLMR